MHCTFEDAETATPRAPLGYLHAVLHCICRSCELGGMCRRPPLCVIPLRRSPVRSSPGAGGRATKKATRDLEPKCPRTKSVDRMGTRKGGGVQAPRGPERRRPRNRSPEARATVAPNRLGSTVPLSLLRQFRTRSRPPSQDRKNLLNTPPLATRVLRLYMSCTVLFGRCRNCHPSRPAGLSTRTCEGVEKSATSAWHSRCPVHKLSPREGCPLYTAPSSSAPPGHCCGLPRAL